MNKLIISTILTTTLFGCSNTQAVEVPKNENTTITYDMEYPKNLIECQAAIVPIYKGTKQPHLLKYLEVTDYIINLHPPVGEEVFDKAIYDGIITSQDVFDSEEGFVDKEGLTNIWNYCNMLLIKQK